jgi:ferredoxin-like protein FixX
MSKKKTTEEFIADAVKVHGDRYDYSKVAYTNNHTKVLILCCSHGEFWQQPNNHLQGKGCSECANAVIKLAQNASATQQYLYAKSHIISRFTAVHGERYDYSNVIYGGAHVKVNILCRVHGEFAQAPSHHLKGSGCPMCQTSGFQKAKPGLLYCLKIKDKPIWKIGITNRTVEARFDNTDLANIEVIWTKRYENGQECYDQEQRLIKALEHIKYTGEPVLSSGNTELFTEDISLYLRLLPL